MISLSKHKKRHKLLHNHLDELIADWITHTRKLPSKSTVLELLTWSNEQIENPTASNTHGEGED